MTFITEGEEVPLQWGQIWSTAKAVPTKKVARRKKAQKPNNHKRLIITLLVLFNVSLLSATMATADHSTQVEQAGEVQAMIAPTPVVDSIEIKPIKAPAAVEAQVVAVKAEPTPTPTVAVAAARTTRVSSTVPLVGNWDALLQQYFGAAWQQAKRVMMCESGGNASAIGPTDSQGYNPIGLFQIKNFPGRPSTAALMDAATNIAHAAQMSGKGTNWRAWQCKP